ncbi:putative nucleoporin [Plasmopara halstedii]
MASSAFEILRSTRQLPVVEKELLFNKHATDAAAFRSTAGAAWGKSARKWVAASTPEFREFGDAMPRELRTLVATSFDIFTRTQQESQQGALDIVHTSREYREGLKTCIFALEDRLEAKKEDFEMNIEEERAFLDLLKVSLAIWHLCELLLLRGGARGADKTLAYELALWVQEHYCSTLLEKVLSESERLKKEEKPEQDADFWSTIKSLVMAGDGESAWSLLSSHSSYKSLVARDALSLTQTSTTTVFQEVQKLLVTMPGRIGRMETFEPAEWKYWNDACHYLLNTNGYIKSNVEFKTLLEILIAKEDVLTSHANTWYELMMARLFLNEPKTIAHRFEFLMANCFRAYHSDTTSMGNFDCIILAIMKYDIESALQDLISLGFSWMTAHLTDLLQRRNVILADEVVPEASCTLRERFLLHYAMEIGASSGMWQFAVRYYEYCPQFGASAIRSALAREPLQTDYKTERLLAYCHGKKFLAETQNLISRQRAEECKLKKTYASAMYWMLRGNLLDDVDALCDDVLQECSNSNSLTPLHEAVQFMESHTDLVRPQKLVWVVKYREFQLVLDDLEALRQQLETNEVSNDKEKRVALKDKLRFVSIEAAKRLNWLFNSNEAPKTLCSQLLQHTERLLKESPNVFQSRHLYSLLDYLQRLDRSFDRQQFYNSSSNTQLKERIETLISRNLAEAMLQEASVSGYGVETLKRQAIMAPSVENKFLIADLSGTPMEE